MLKHFRNHMRWIMVTIALAFLLSTFMMYDSGSRRGNRGSTTEDGRIEDYTVVTINGTALMRSEMERMVSNYIQQSGMRDVKSTDIPHLYQAVLDNAVFQAELNKEAEARRFSASEEEITANINVMADSFPTREAYYQAVERSGVKMTDLRNDVKRQITMEKTMTSAMAVEPVSEDSVFEFYDAMKGLFYSKPKGYMFDVIQVSVDKTAYELRERVAADVEKWLEIASEDTYSPDVTRTTTEPLFFAEYAVSDDENISFMMDLGIGEVGPVTEIRSNDFMIAIKRENTEESFTPYEEVSADIRSMLEQQQQSAAYEKFQKDLVARAVVEIKDPSLFPLPESRDIESTLEDTESHEGHDHEENLVESADIIEGLTPLQTSDGTVSGSTTDTPVVPNPETSEPTTETPVVPDPETSEPITEIPVVPIPETSEPTTETPVVPDPEISEPITEIPVVPIPETSEPITETPVTTPETSNTTPETADNPPSPDNSADDIPE